MRVLGLDVGERRTGVAIGDPTGLLASPLPAIGHRAPSERVRAVLDVAADNEADEIVVGMPVSLSGRRGRQAKWVGRFVEELREQSPVRVTTFDERYTTVEAERMLKQAGVEPSRDRGRADSAAAAVLLQAYLDAKRAG